MATKIYLVGVTVHMEKGAAVHTYPMDKLTYTISNSVLSIYHKGAFIVSDASSDIQDIADATLANDAAVHAYLGQFIGNADLSSASNATATVVTSLVADTLLLAANEHRAKALIFNNSTSKLYIKYGSGASLTSFIHKVSGPSTEPVEITDYKGAIYGYWDVANGDAQVTEVHI